MGIQAWLCAASQPGAAKANSGQQRRVYRPWCLRRAGLLLACTWLTGCVQLSYSHFERFRPPAQPAVEGLQSGLSLNDCLASLGAPWQVLEREQDPGLILVYAWERGSGWGLSVSGGNDDNAPGSINLVNSRALPRALTLWFDGSDRLIRFEQGFLPPDLAAGLVGLQAFRPGGGR
jgi:hypothetical protein